MQSMCIRFLCEDAHLESERLSIGVKGTLIRIVFPSVFGESFGERPWEHGRIERHSCLKWFTL